MSLELRSTLSKLYVGREKELLAGKWSEIPEWVFVNGEGNPLDESKLRKRFARALKKAGLSGHRLYDLRHTYATALLAKSVPVTYVAAQLGHAKPTTTLQWYAHWLPKGSDKSFVDSLDRASLIGDGTDFGTNGDSSVMTDEIPFDFTGGPSQARTGDPLIKSQLLYQLS
jgi:integrase